MPIACIFGVWMAPVSDKLCGGILAFGAGSLIFAVTVSIFGHALHKLTIGEMYRYEDYWCIAGAAAGSLFFMWVARWLEQEPADDDDAEGNAESHLPQVQVQAYSRPSLTNAPGSRKSGALADAALAVQAHRTKLPVDKLDAEATLSDAAQMKKDRFIAVALFAGLLIDGIPEGVFMGFMAAENNLSTSLIVALFIANFPQAFSSAALLSKTGMGLGSIMAMWGGLCILVGVLAGASCAGLLTVFPAYAEGAKLPPVGAVGVALVECFTGGAMLSCICSVMLPEAAHLVGKDGPLYFQSGFLSVLGFLCAVTLEVCVSAIEGEPTVMKSTASIYHSVLQRRL